MHLQVAVLQFAVKYRSGSPKRKCVLDGWPSCDRFVINPCEALCLMR